jgi:hypothetical protein
LRIGEAEFGELGARAAARIAELAFGGIDARDLGRCVTCDYFFGEGAVAATDIEPGKAFGRRDPIEELLPTSLLQRPISRS